jgi:hypothetical protein
MTNLISVEDRTDRVEDSLVSLQVEPQSNQLTKREQIWLNAYCSVANAFNSTKEVSASWADECLKQFDKRFPQ